MPVVTPETFPAEILSRFRGTITDARPAYPEVLHLTVRDRDGGEWRFATQEAESSPARPQAFRGRTIDNAVLDDQTGTLTVGFTDGSTLSVTPDHEGADDDLEAWELFTPERTILTYGPRGRWLLGRFDNLV